MAEQKMYGLDERGNELWEKITRDYLAGRLTNRPPRREGIRGGRGVLFENGITDEAIGKGGVGTVSIQSVAEDGTETDTGRNVEARNRYADVAVSKKVGLVKKKGVWFLIAAECC